MLLLAESTLSLDYLASFGLGVVVLGVACWWLSAQLEKARLREVELNKTILDISREALNGINKLASVIENLNPTIGNLGNRNGEHLDKATKELKEHITSTSNHLESVVKLTNK
jgi:hypothetical protein